MLKFRYITLLALLLTVACSKSEEAGSVLPAEPQEEVITFGEVSTTGGRADLVESGTGTLFRSQPFAVYGDWIPTTAEGSRVEMFHDQQVIYNRGGVSPSGWNYSPTQAWRHGGDYDFRAYWPASAKKMGTASARNLALEYSILSDDFDLMVAYTHCPSGNNGQPVSLNFRHTLAAVAVKFRTSTTGQNYRVKNFFFAGLHYIGALGYYDTDASVDLTDRWLFSEGSRGRVNPQNILLSQRLREWSDSAGRVLTTSADDFPEEFLLFPPQSMAVGAGTPAPSLTFTVDVVWGTTDTVTSTVTLPATNAAGEEMVWRAGKKYIYIVTVDSDRFDVEVKTCDWDRVDGVTGDIEM